MSEQRNHEADPDRAALDELRRAFGVGDHDPAAVTTAEMPSRRSDDPKRSAGSTPAGSPATGIRGLDELGADVAAESDVEHPGHTGPIDLVIVEQEPGREPTAAWEPEVPDDLVDADPPEPTPEALTAPAPPRIIRIDDITGAVGDAPPEAALDASPGSASPETAPPATGGRPTIISIDADDLPDAMYVSGSLEGDSSRSIVFIEDDTAGDVLTTESDRDLRRGIEPRMRERRVQVKRAQSRKRLKWVVAGFVVLLVAIGALAVLGSSLFSVRAEDVAITGNVYTDPEALQEVVDDLVGSPTLLVDTQAAERRLEQIPWVAAAKVTVSFPHTASIEIREREALATYRGPDQRFRVIDRDGRVLDVLDRYPIAYVLVTGPDPVDLEPGQFAPAGYAGAAELAKNLTGSVRGQVDRIEVTANGSSLVMWLDDGSDVRFGEARDLFTKLVRLETRLALEPDREPGPIDVSTS